MTPATPASEAAAEQPILWLGMTGFAPQQRAVLEASLVRPPRFPRWRICAFGAFTQLPFLHELLPEQCEALVQVVRQAPASHVNGSQSTAVAVRHAPAPSQVRAGITLPVPEHAGTLQTVPAAYLAHPP
jgi:hypothetical protein